MPRRNSGQDGGTNAPRSQSSDQFRLSRVENEGSYFSENQLLFSMKIVPAWSATTAMVEDFLATTRPAIHHAQRLNIPLGNPLTSIKSFVVLETQKTRVA